MMKFAALILLIVAESGCVSMQRNRRDVREAFIRGMQRARKIAYVQGCKNAVDVISARIEIEEKKK